MINQTQSNIKYYESVSTLSKISNQLDYFSKLLNVRLDRTSGQIGYLTDLIKNSTSDMNDFNSCMLQHITEDHLELTIILNEKLDEMQDLVKNKINH